MASHLSSCVCVCVPLRSDCVFDGLAQLGQLGYGDSTADLWWDIFALVIYSIIFLSLAYIVLRLIKKEK